MTALVTTASAQSQSASNAEITFIDTNNQPLPTGYVTVRAADGRVLVPASSVGGTSFVFQNVGRKIQFEFGAKDLKTNHIDFVLEQAPQVYVRLMVDPATGHVKELSQKPYFPNSRPRNHLKAFPGGQQSIGGPPANDLCAGALPIAAGDTAFDTTNAATDGPANGCGSGGQINNDIWFDYLATADGVLTVSTCGIAAYDTTLAIYDGLTCPPAAPLACNDDFGGCSGFTSQVSAPVVNGQHYLLRVGGFGLSSRGAGTLHVEQTGGGGGGGNNDNCEEATNVPCNSTAMADSSAATTAMDDPAFSCRFGGPGQGFGTLWFKFVATSTNVVLDTSNSGVSDTLMALYSGTCGSFTELACDDDGGSGLRSLIMFDGLNVGDTYYVQVAGFGASNVGPITLDITCPTGAPQGDECSDPIVVGCDSSATFNNATFTTDPLDPAFSCRFGEPAQGFGTAWLSFTATDTSAFLDTNSSTGVTDTLLAVYDGSCGALVELCCSEDEGQGLLSEVCCENLVVGQTYLVQVASFSATNVGEITLSVQCPCPGPPANDECDGAIDLGALPTSIVFDTTGATDDISVPCEVASGPFNNVWFSLTGTGGTITATTCNAGTTHPDTKISVFCGDCMEPVCVTGNDDDCPSGGPTFASTVSWCSQPGVQYLMTVGGFSPGQVGVVQLDVSSSGSGCVAEVQCLPQGACCLADGTCVVTIADDCAAQGGTYQGDGTECFSNAVADGGFEGGAFSGNWNESSTNFGTPLCDAGCGFGGGTGPHSGSWWCWFGGIQAFEEGAVSQLINIPASATTLDFWVEIPVSSGNGVDFMEASIDGGQVYLVNESDGTGPGYFLVQIPLGGFADGGNHNLEFHSIVTGAAGLSNFFVDDVSVNSQSISCEPPIVCHTLDFQTEDDDVTPLVNGQHINTEFGYLVNLSSSGANAGMGIFDSNPGGPNNPSQDLDLLVDCGNILILQTENFPPDGNDIFPRPNDDDDGGTVSFSFLTAVMPMSVDLIDIDGTDGMGSVVLTDAGGAQRVYSIPANWTGDITQGGDGKGTLDLTTLAPQGGFGSTATATEDAGFDADAVVQIDVHLGGSGGIDNLSWCE